MKATRQEIEQARPKSNFQAIVDPQWFCDMTPAKDMSLLQIYHPQNGWLSFCLPPAEAEKLGVFLLRQAGVATDKAEAAPVLTTKPS